MPPDDFAPRVLHFSAICCTMLHLYNDLASQRLITSSCTCALFSYGYCVHLAPHNSGVHVKLYCIHIIIIHDEARLGNTKNKEAEKGCTGTING